MSYMAQGADPLSMLMANSNISSKKEDDFEPFTFEEEQYLKKLIIKNCFDKELEYYRNNTSIENLTQNTVLVKYAYQHLWRNFPLFNLAHLSSTEKEKLQNCVKQLLLNYPEFSRLHHRSNPLLGRRGGSAVDTLDLRIVTKLEKSRNDKVRDFIIKANRGQVDFNKIQPDIKEVLDDLSTRRYMFYLIQIVCAGIKKPEDVKPEIFSKIENASSVKDLPPEYRRVFGLEGSASTLTYLFAQPGKTEKFRNIYNQMPIKTLETLFAVTSPMKIITDLISLFLSRPMGTKSLFMRICEGLTDIPRTERAISEIRQKLNAKPISEKIHNYIQTSYNPSEKTVSFTPTPQTILGVLKDESFAPKIEKNLIEALKEDHLKSLVLLCEQEIILRSKEQMVQFVGSDAITTPIKEIVSVISPSLIELFNKGDFRTLLSKSFKVWNNLISIAEKKLPEDQTTEAFAKEMAVLEEAFLPFIKDLLKSDEKNIFAQTIGWFSQFFSQQYKLIELDLDQLMKGLSTDDKNLIKAETEAWIKFKKKERNAKMNFTNIKAIPMPTQKAIPELLSKRFLDLIKKDL